MLSGWSVRGKFACPICGFGTCSKWLENGGKYCFMGHRRFLPIDHPFRRDRRNFDGNQEWRNAPTLENGSTAMQQLNEEVDVYNANGEIVSFSEGWKRKSIFFTLPYWETNLIRNNLDVMHLEKNVCDNILGTLLNIEGKSKDNLKA